MPRVVTDSATIAAAVAKVLSDDIWVWPWDSVCHCGVVVPSLLSDTKVSVSSLALVLLFLDVFSFNYNLHGLG